MWRSRGARCPPLPQGREEGGASVAETRPLLLRDLVQEDRVGEVPTWSQLAV